MVVADTLEENVKELHKFLYGADENYQPSQNIVEASAKIIELVGGADTLVDQAPVASNEAGESDEIVWQGDGSGNYDYNDYNNNDYDSGSYDDGSGSGSGSDYDSSYGNDYGTDSGGGGDYSGEGDYDNGGYTDGSYSDGSEDGGFDDGGY